MAAPIVTVAVALIKSIDPTLTAPEIKSILKTTGKPAYTTSGRPVGNIIQIENALRKVQNEEVDDCEDIREKIDSLQNLIKLLKLQCGEIPIIDTLSIPEDADDLGFLDGRWKSTSPLTNSITNVPVELYFDFNGDDTGQITYVEENGDVCISPIDIEIINNGFSFDQNQQATCQVAKNGYAKNYFKCQADSNGKAKCVSISENNPDREVQFTLIKTN
jgi:hypothetical protein